MDRGTYSAASGGLLQLRKLEVVNNNLANTNTAGFKKQILTGEAQSFDDTFARLVEGKDPYARPDHLRTPGVTNVKTVTDFSPGAIRQTGNEFDVALRGAKDFFVVSTPDGLQYTRAGNFTIGVDGSLSTVDGLAVQGDGGPITIDQGTVKLSPDGSVLVNGAEVGRIQVVRVEDLDSLEPRGGTRFALRAGTGAPAAVDADLIVGSLEMANVSTISSMVDLIAANRAFQMYTKTAETVDTMNQTAINQIGRRTR